MPAQTAHQPEISNELLIDYSPGPTAIRAHLSPARAKLVWGPIRTGKSVWACWRIFFKAMEAAKKGIALKAVIVRDTYRNLEDTTLKTWMEWFGKCGRLVTRSSVKDFLLKVPDSELEHQVLFRYGQTAADASSFLSSDYGVIFLEEVAPAFTPTGLVSPGIAEEVFDLALTRLVQKGIDNPEMVLTCNPPIPQHWANRRFIAQPEAVLRKQNFWHFFFPAAENEKNLRPGYYDELRTSLAGKDHIIRRFVDGEIVSIHPGLPVFSRDFKPIVHVRDTLTPIATKPIILGWDFGMTPAVVFTQIDSRGRWLWLHELQGGYVDDRLSEQIGIRRFGEMVKALGAEKFPGFSLSDLGYGDPAMVEKQPTDEKTCKQVLESIGFVLSPGEVDIPARVESIRDRLNTMIEGEPALLISRQGCPILIEALSGGYRYGISRDANRIHGGEPLKNEYSHLVDGAGYIASKLFRTGYVKLASDHTPRLPPTAMCA